MTDSENRDALELGKSGIETDRLRLSFLVPLTFAIMVAVGVFITGYHHHQQEDAKKITILSQASASELYQSSIRRNTIILQANIEILEKEKALHAALANGDRATLLAIGTPLLDSMRKTSGITHLYFTRANRVSLLRVHRPKDYGDIIDRFTTLEAERTGAQAHGVEFGKMGTFNLRVVNPWYADKERKHLIGFLELGMDADHLLADMQEYLDVQPYVLIRKKFLNREIYESSLKTLGHTPNWDRFPDFIVSTNGNQSITHALMERVGNRKGVESNNDIVLDGISYRSIVVPLLDAMGRDVGQAVVMVNNSSNAKSEREIFIFTGIAVVLAGGLLLSFFYWLANRVGAQLESRSVKLADMATHDVLTQLPNRRLLLEQLLRALSASARIRQYGALLFLDLDNFKTLNDTKGHEFGDRLLVEVARRLRLCVREVDTVARLGGDEFVVLIENVSADAKEASQNVAQVAEKIRAVLATPYQIEEHTHHSTPSVGVCLFYGNTESADELLKRADLAMYQAKNSGRNKVQFFEPHLQQAVESFAALEADLREAVSGQQLRLYYQIQLDNDLRPIGAEALVRWIHPKRGFVSPADFIPVAEKSSLILEIGDWVLDTACQQLAVWSHIEAARHLVLAVNISAQQFKQPDFVEQIVAVLQKHRVDPARLKLELTESVAVDDLDFVAAKMFALRHVVGVTLSLDDFGTGYSSLSVLKKLPLNQIKIDQSFVRNMTTDASDAVMVKTIIAMAHNFGLHVIAEGVETDAQHSALKENNCMAYQGYLFSKPLPIDEFKMLLKQDNL